MNLGYIKRQIKWIIEQIQCIKNGECICDNIVIPEVTPFVLSTTDSEAGDNGHSVVTADANQLSVFDEQFQLLVDNDVTTLSLTPSFITSLSTQSTYSINIVANQLNLLEDGNIIASEDLSLYLDDTNLARIVQGVVDGNTGIATITRDDNTTFTIDFSPIIANIYTTDGSVSTNRVLTVNPFSSMTFQGGGASVAIINSLSGIAEIRNTNAIFQVQNGIAIVNSDNIKLETTTAGVLDTINPGDVFTTVDASGVGKWQTPSSPIKEQGVRNAFGSLVSTILPGLQVRYSTVGAVQFQFRISGVANFDVTDLTSRVHSNVDGTLQEFVALKTFSNTWDSFYTSSVPTLSAGSLQEVWFKYNGFTYRIYCTVGSGNSNNLISVERF